MRAKLLLLLTVVLLANCTSDKKKDASFLHLIPKNAVVIIKVNDFESFRNEINDNEILSKLAFLSFSKKISDRLKPLEFIASESEGILSILESEDADFDFTYVSKDTLPYIYTDSIKNKTVETFVYENHEINKYQIEENTFWSTTINKREIIGSSQQILEKIVLQVDKKTESNSQLASKLLTVPNTGKLAHILINLNKSDPILSKILNSDTEIKASEFADWMSLDVQLENDELVFNGISIAKDSTKNNVSLFSHTKPLSNTTTAFAPSDADFIKSYTFTNYNAFSVNQMAYHNATSQSDSLLNTTEEIGIMEINQNKIILLKTYGTANITDYLKQIQSNATEFQGSEILELRETDFLNTRLDPIVKDFNAKFACVIENTFVFSETTETLQQVLQNYKSGNVLNKTVLFRNAEKLTTQESSLLFLSNNIGFDNTVKEVISTEISKEFRKSDFSDYLFGSQLVADAGFLHTSFFIKKITAAEQNNSVTPLFSLELDNAIANKPQFVKNHRTQRQEIVVQDKENMLYLISTKGKILWKKQLEGAIQGKIHQVDIYKNRRLQLAFTTNNQFLILDRNGEEVAPFSIKYEGGNVNPLAVFDYEGNKDYRFVVTQNKKVFMYNNKARIVSGFKYKEAEDIILDAPQHFQIGKKDYLVFKLDNGALKILNRVGDVRIKVAEKISFSENEVKLYRNKITLTSEEGLLYQIGTDGKIERMDLSLTPEHGLDATSRTLAIMNDNILRIRDKKVTLDLGVYSKPTIFYLNDKIYVSVTDIQNQKSYLYDSQAEPIPNFPIYGTSIIDMADMNNDKKPELVIKDQENSIIVYKLQ